MQGIRALHLLRAVCAAGGVPSMHMDSCMERVQHARRRHAMGPCVALAACWGLVAGKHDPKTMQ